MIKDIDVCVTELMGLSMVLSGLSNQLDNKESDSLNVNSLGMALYAVSSHLERIADDLGGIVV